MATIRDAHIWLRDTLGGDAPRANSLLKVGQTHGLLTTSGRGPQSPHLILTDFATLPCMALMTEGPTKAPAVVQGLWRLSLSRLTADPGDGTERQLDINDLPALAENLDPLLDPYVGKLSAIHHNATDNLIGVLTALFDRFAPKHDFHNYDTLELESAGERRAVHLTLHGARYGWSARGYRNEGDDAFMLKLTFGDVAAFSGCAVETRRTLRSGALNALAAFTRDRAKGAE